MKLQQAASPVVPTAGTCTHTNIEGQIQLRDFRAHAYKVHDRMTLGGVVLSLRKRRGVFTAVGRWYASTATANVLCDCSM